MSKNAAYTKWFCADEEKGTGFFCTNPIGHTGNHKAMAVSGGFGVDTEYSVTGTSVYSNWENKADISTQKSCTKKATVSNHCKNEGGNGFELCTLLPNHAGDHVYSYEWNGEGKIIKTWPNVPLPMPKVSVLNFEKETKTVYLELNFDAAEYIRFFFGMIGGSSETSRRFYIEKMARALDPITGDYWKLKSTGFLIITDGGCVEFKDETFNQDSEVKVLGFTNKDTSFILKLGEEAARTLRTVTGATCPEGHKIGEFFGNIFDILNKVLPQSKEWVIGKGIGFNTSGTIMFRS
jgi:hypothetical protein